MCPKIRCSDITLLKVVVVVNQSQESYTIMCLREEAVTAIKQNTSRGVAIARILVSLLLVLVTLVGILYASNRGFRRTVDFWIPVAPLIIEYKFLQAKCRYFDKCSDDEWKELMEAYHVRTAPKIVSVIIKLGGIYVKIGQMLSTVGGGLIDDAYVSALTPLQNGLPPRPVADISRIIEEALGQKLTDLFESFDEIPIGAASIAQAHKAVLKKDGTVVIVKVQYPQVAELYEADFQNLELVTRLIMPDNLSTIDTMRERHRKELDFTIEAENLRECSENMKRRGLEPQLIRIPRVIGKATQHVLIMEYMEGTSLADAMEEEQQQIAISLGMSSAKALRAKVMEDLKTHFLEGGGQSDLIKVQAVAPMVRAYAGLCRRLSNIRTKVRNGASRAVHVLSDRRVEPTLQELYVPRKIDLSRVLKTLVMVHGVQVMLDGVYNADPHPGNVIIMPCGRLGLIDYGMVGRLEPDERELIASTVLAFASGDKETVVRNYVDSGYIAAWIGGANHTDDVIHRFASFHLDRINLSPLHVDGKVWPVLDLLGKSIERVTPDWIEQMKRIGCLLIGVSSQAGRPISLSKEWRRTARSLFQERQRQEQGTD